MKLSEEKRDLFSVEDDYYLAHCISADARMGAGIAVDFARRFPDILVLGDGWESNQVGSCILIDRVFNLITKWRYWQKPSYVTMEDSIVAMRELCIANNVKKLAMPKIGCGLDRLAWGTVKKLIFKHFQDLDIEIKVCIKEGK